MKPRRTVALVACVSLICSGCCIVQTRRDTGDLYIPPLSQWTWLEWGCVLLVGCAAYYIGTQHTGDNLVTVRDADTPMREPCEPEFPVC